jgi:predicted transposase/invertase (TIGR01784 family)
VFFIKEAKNLDVVPEGMDDPGLKAAFDEANIQSWSSEELEAYDYAGLRETEEKLRLAKAIKDKQIKIAKQMKSKGMDIKTISELTDLSEDDVKEI